MKTPVAFFIFNRPETTRRVFAEIARAKPTILLVIADGARQERHGEVERCRLTRALVEEGITWKCDVVTNFSDINLGCKARMASGLDWVFHQVDRAIILEDDCLPAHAFFPFCEELLDRYEGDERVGQISGANFQFGARRSAESYYFSRYNQIWGWASWRRAWRRYDADMKLWPEIKLGRWLDDIFSDVEEKSYWENLLDLVHQGKIDTWDYQWAFACWVNSLLMIVPNVNLISNIGFGVQATHTFNCASKLACIPTEDIEFPLRHPKFVVADSRADSLIRRHILSSAHSHRLVRFKQAVRRFLDLKGCPQ